MTEIEIKPTDLISGSTYLKFLHDYKWSIFCSEFFDGMSGKLILPLLRLSR